MPSSVRPRKPKARQDDLIRRLTALTTGLTVAKVLKADERELWALDKALSPAPIREALTELGY